MTAIPGAEDAPILTRRIMDRGLNGSEFQIEREIRWRADVTDPDDQRAIWRLAALALGATEEEASVAVMLRAERDWWVLRPATFQSRRYYLQRVLASDLPHATAALCRAVWGPKS